MLAGIMGFNQPQEPATRVLPPEPTGQPVKLTRPASNRWTKLDELAEFVCKLAPAGLLSICILIAGAGMFFEREYPALIEIIAAGCLGALNPSSDRNKPKG